MDTQKIIVKELECQVASFLDTYLGIPLTIKDVNPQI